MDTTLAGLAALRRRLHRRPEVGFTEFETIALVLELLGPVVDSVAYGDEVVDPSLVRGLPDPTVLEQAAERAEAAGVAAELVQALDGGRTGVVMTLAGDRPGPAVGLRVDLDALGVTESTEREHAPARLGFGSEIAGAMHACGHDGHVAIAAALVTRLADRRFPGTIRLILQPAEEGVRGAAALRPWVTEGLDVLLGIHLGIGLSVGEVAAGVHDLLATEKVRVSLRGTSAHAALSPESGRSVTLAAAAMTLALHSLPQHSGGITRLNVGRIEAGSSANVVASAGTIELEYRSDAAGLLADLSARVREVVDGTARAFGVQADLEVIGAATTLACDPELVSALAAAAARTPGIDRVLPSASMSASEDVSLLIRSVQQRGGTGSLMLVGASSPAPHHTPLFDLDERSLPLAVDWLEAVVRGGTAARGPLAGD